MELNYFVVRECVRAFLPRAALRLHGVTHLERLPAFLKSTTLTSTLRRDLLLDSCKAGALLLTRRSETLRRAGRRDCPTLRTQLFVIARNEAIQSIMCPDCFVPRNDEQCPTLGVMSTPMSSS
jgi:hypothetical protein